jgi:hypothetical protein
VIKVNLDGDFVNPAQENWSAMDDTALWHAAQAKIPQAVAELARRERENTPLIHSAADE